jgi:hypothetical protein
MIWQNVIMIWDKTWLWYEIKCDYDIKCDYGMRMRNGRRKCDRMMWDKTKWYEIKYAIRQCEILRDTMGWYDIWYDMTTYDIWHDIG